MIASIQVLVHTPNSKYGVHIKFIPMWPVDTDVLFNLSKHVNVFLLTYQILFHNIVHVPMKLHFNDILHCGGCGDLDTWPGLDRYDLGEETFLGNSSFVLTNTVAPAFFAPFVKARMQGNSSVTYFVDTG